MKYLVCLLLLCVSCRSLVDVPAVYDIEYLHRSPGSIAMDDSSGVTVFHVKSEMGIGTGSITLTQGAWPDVVMLRLHLKGLEGLSLKGSGHVFEKEDLSITKNSDAGMSYYEVELPQPLLVNGQIIHINWVDFYR